jgi:hypothetical protein
VFVRDSRAVDFRLLDRGRELEAVPSNSLPSGAMGVDGASSNCGREPSWLKAGWGVGVAIEGDISHDAPAQGSARVRKTTGPKA